MRDQEGHDAANHIVHGNTAYAADHIENRAHWRRQQANGVVDDEQHAKVNRVDTRFTNQWHQNWCQDENRHGDFFDAVMQSQPQMLNDWKAKLWCRFFLLSVFATMYLNDLQRADFYAAIGLNARDYDIHVIEKTNETAGRVFPVMLDVNNPEFYQRLDICVKNNEQLTAIANSGSPKFVQFFQKLPYYLSSGLQLLKLYLMKPIDVTSSQGAVY